MAVKSEAQRKWLQSRLEKGEIKQAEYDEWLKGTGAVPDRTQWPSWPKSKPIKVIGAKRAIKTSRK